MGTLLSTPQQKDYNTLLERLPRDQILVKEYDVLTKHPDFLSHLSIPDVVRISRIDNQATYDDTFNNNDPTQFIPNRSQTPIQDESNNASSNVVNSQLISNESKHPSSPPHLQQQAKKPHLRNNFKRTLRPSNSMSFRDGNTTVLARSSFNIRRAQYGAGTFNHGRTIINRNGEQYIEDMNERIDRRFVRSIDNNGVKRYYEVIDIIPTKTVRRYKQSHGQNTLKSTKYDQSERPVRINSFRQSVQSPLLDFTGMDNPQHINDEYHRYLQTFNETNNVTNLTSQEHSLLTNDSSSMNTADVSSNTSVPNDNYFRRRKPPKASVTSSSKTKMFYNNNIPPADINRKTSDSVSASSSQESKENKKSDQSSIDSIIQSTNVPKKRTVENLPDTQFRDYNSIVFPKDNVHYKSSALYSNNPINTYGTRKNHGFYTNATQYTPLTRPFTSLKISPVNNNQYVRSAQSDPRAIINNITYI